jgi:hypothetical protein
MIEEALFLGFSTGAYCAAFCAPVLIPYIFSGDNNDGKNNTVRLLLFMAGRLLGYAAIGAFLGIGGELASRTIEPSILKTFTAAVYALTGLLMLLTGFLYNFQRNFFCRAVRKFYKPEGGALLFGIFTGLNFCPPFFAAASRVAGKGGILYGISYFLLFYIGTSVFLLPLFGIPFIKKNLDKIRIIARILLLILGFYFFLFLGIFRIMK